MDGFSDDTVWAVQQAIMNLLDLVDSVAQTDSEGDRERLRAEAKKTVLILTAAIIIADGKYEAAEQAFIRHLVDLSDEPGVELSYLNEYAAQWMTASIEVPCFFRAAVANGGDVARSMLREIQFIGNNICISDSEFQSKERESVAQYVKFLEDFIGR